MSQKSTNNHVNVFMPFVPFCGTFLRGSAAVGGFVWLLLLPTISADAPERELIHKVVLFGILVVVPLGISLVEPHDQQTSMLYRLVVFSQPVAALLAVASFFFETGPLAASLSSAWLVFSLLVALFGLARLKSRGLYPVAELSIDAGLLYLTVAGVGLVIYRLGIQPFDYGETIILLTVVHFHFAGFAAPIIAGMNGRVLRERKHPQKIFAASVFGIVGAMPLVAAGITFSPWVGLIGTLILAAGLVLLAVLTVGWVMSALPLGKRLLLVVGAVSSCTAMVLACLYAYSLATKTLILNIPTMAMTHGLLNAFGFVTCNLIAWWGARDSNPP
ncbi:MAG TPA: YndJ family protein [Pyrinomonadaceae bacterium]|nr:YndJ family protein [Pyrinomonadaceae bacterium]